MRQSRRRRGEGGREERGDDVGTGFDRNYARNYLFQLPLEFETAGFESRPPRHKSVLALRFFG